MTDCLAEFGNTHGILFSVGSQICVRNPISATVMGSGSALSGWFDLGERKKELEKEYNSWKEARHTLDSTTQAEVEEEDKAYRRRIDDLLSDLERLKHEALARGNNPVARQKGFGL